MDLSHKIKEFMIEVIIAIELVALAYAIYSSSQ